MKANSRPDNNKELPNGTNGLTSSNNQIRSVRRSVQRQAASSTKKDEDADMVAMKAQSRRWSNYAKHQEMAASRRAFAVVKDTNNNNFASPEVLARMLEQDLQDKKDKQQAKLGASPGHREGDVARNLEAAKLQALAERNGSTHATSQAANVSAALEQKVQDRQAKHKAAAMSSKIASSAGAKPRDQDVVQDPEAAKLKAVAEKKGPRIHYEDNDFQDVELNEARNQGSPPPTLRPGAVSIIGTRQTDSPSDDDYTMEERGRFSDDGISRNMDTQQPGSELHLINAVLVESDEEKKSVDIPYAHATPAPEDIRAPCNKKLYCMLGSALCLLVIAVVVVVVVLVTGNNGSSGPPENLAIATLVFQLDEKPEEVGWKLECDGFTIADVPPSVYTGLNNRRIEVNTEVALEEDCELSVVDSGNDGISGGFFELYLGDDTSNEEDLLARRLGDDFAGIATESFRATALAAGSPTDSPAVPPSAPPSPAPVGSPSLGPTTTPPAAEPPTNTPTLSPTFATPSEPPTPSFTTIVPTPDPSPSPGTAPPTAVVPTVPSAPPPTPAPTEANDTAPPSRNNVDQTCRAKYGSTITVCQESSSECSFFVPLNESSCDAYCGGRGGSCLSAMGDEDDGCTPNGRAHDCSAVRSATICTCSM